MAISGGTSTGTGGPTFGGATGGATGNNGLTVGVDYTSQVYGRTIPLSGGRRGLTGVPIWASKLRPFTETVYEYVTGTTRQWVGRTSYKRDFAVAFGRHLAPVAERGTLGLLRLWANDEKIYDATDPLSTRPELTFTLYSGSSTQTQDALMLLDRGEIVPAYHDLIYIVFKDWRLRTFSVPLPGPGPYLAPAFGIDYKLPVIRAEFVDGLQISNVKTDFTLLSGTNINDNDYHLLPDWDEGRLYTFSQTTTANANLHIMDTLSLTEIARLPITGTYTQLAGMDNAVAYDSRNKFAVVSKDGISNTVAFVSISLETGVITDTFGTASTALEPTDAAGGNSDTTGLPIANIPFANVSEMTYVGDGNGQRPVAVFNASVTDFLTVVAMDNAGQFPAQLPKAGTLFTDNIASFEFTEAGSTSAIKAIPLYDYNRSAFQDGAVLVGHGQLLYVVFFGIRNGSAILFGRYVIKDFGAGYTVEHILFDPRDKGAVVITSNNGGADWQVSKYPCFFTNGATAPSASSLNGHAWQGTFPAFNVSQGAGFPVTVLPNYELVTIPDMNTGVNFENAVRFGELSRGTFGYTASPSFAILNMNDGSVTHTGFTNNVGANFWDSRQGACFFNDTTGGIDVVKLNSANGTAQMIGTYLRWLALSLGYVTADIDVDAALTAVNADNTVTGVIVDHAYTVQQLFEALGRLYDFRYFESEGKINFTRAARGASAAAPQFTLTLDDLAYNAEGGLTPNDALVTEIGEPKEQVGGVAVQYLDLDQNYSLQTQTYNVDKQTSGLVGVKVENLAVPVVMTTSEAYRRASKIGIRAIGDVETQQFRLPQKYSRLEPNDIVRVQIPPYSYDVILDEVTFNGDWSLSLAGATFASDDNVTVPDQEDLGDYTDVGFGLGDAKPVVLDIPLLRVADNISNQTFRVYVGVTTFGQTSFSNANLVAGLSPSGPFSLFANFDKPLQDGNTVGTLPATSTPFTTDETTVLRVALKSSDADDWESTNDAGLFAGSNAVLVGATGRWELIHFRDVTVINSKVVELRGLNRGRRGTDVNCNNHQPNDQVILVRSVSVDFVDVLKSQPFDAVADVNTTYKYTAEGQPQSRPVQSVDVTLVGGSLKPWAGTEHAAFLGSSYNVNGTTPDYANKLGGGTDLAPSGKSRVPFMGITSAGGTLRVNRLINDAVTTSNDDAAEFVGGFTTEAIVFDFRPFGIRQRIIGFKYRQSNTTAQGNWDFEGSNDGVTWTPLLSNFTLVSGTTTTHSFANTNYYWMYRLKQFSGSLSTAFSSRALEIYFETVSETSGNDIVIEWFRRDRLGGEFVDVAQPMSEATEAYEIEILNGAGAVVRTVQTSAPRYVYTAADQATDGFSPPLASLRVKVYQLSATVDRGYEVDKTLTVA